MNKFYYQSFADESYFFICWILNRKLVFNVTINQEFNLRLLVNGMIARTNNKYLLKTDSEAILLKTDMAKVMIFEGPRLYPGWDR